MSSFDDFCRLYCAPPNSPLSLDLSFSGLDQPFLDRMEPQIQRAFAAMDALESGAIANPDENRMVGHYWLRDLDRLPDPGLRARVRSDNDRIYRFLADVREGKAAGMGGRFTDLLSIGIGGSALGPQLVIDAVGDLDEGGLEAHFLDNTDPDGIARVLESLAGRLDRTLCVVISKSGGTPETRNGMLLAEEAYRRAGLDFGPHAVAITGEGSKLDQYAEAGKWLARFPMYDWVGGRTSVMSAVGLLPCGLAGVDLSAFLAGAAVVDAATRTHTTRENPAALLALYWHHATNGRGEKDMVVLPYRDRLLLFSRYLQQLVMESLGKEHDLDGNVVEQGIAVYGNKGSTDQHAYVQQLRDGVANFFVVFIESLRDGDGTLEVDPQVTAGDYLSGFLQGTRRALAEKNRPSATITVEDVTAYTLGALIALFERAVGLYATLVNINAYHQPGVEAGKKGAAAILETQKKLLGALAGSTDSRTAAQWAGAAGCDPVDAFYILRHLAKNDRGVKMEGRHPSEATFSAG